MSNIEKPPGIPGFIGKTTLPAVKCTVHEQDDGTIVAVCATGKIIENFIKFNSFYYTSNLFIYILYCR